MGFLDIQNSITVYTSILTLKNRQSVLKVLPVSCDTCPMIVPSKKGIPTTNRT